MLGSTLGPLGGFLRLSWHLLWFHVLFEVLFFDPTMVLNALWGSLSLLFGALGGLLGVSCSSGELLGLLRGLSGCSAELLVACWGRLWSFLGASCGSLGIIFGSCLLRSRCLLFSETLGDDFGLHN